MSVDQSSSSSLQISPTELATCVKVLSKFHANDGYPSIESSEYDRIRPIIHNLYHIGEQVNRQKPNNSRRQIKLINQKAHQSRRAKKRKLTHILIPGNAVQIKDNESHTSERLIQSNPCDICKLNYRTLHFFYDRLCPSCAEFHYKKRCQTTDLTNHIALVTGGRGKIGYRIVLKLLRTNCFVITTSRFPMDLLNRLNKEQDFQQWKDRVHIYGIDFRYSQLVELFTEMLIDKYDRLDFLINNACQTIQRPNEFYQALITNERLTNYSLLPKDHQEILSGHRQFYKRLGPFSNGFNDILYTLSLPSTNNNSDDIIEQTSSINSIPSFDVNQQPIGLHSTNSCLLRLVDISTIEINDVFTINTLAPFILASQLKVLMVDKHPNPDSMKFIINVSITESLFSGSNKTDRHPHTNAAKAALNMMTRTSAIDYKRSNIYMISVDTGEINNEEDLDFKTPIDEEDAAARVLDPIIDTYQQLAAGKTDITIPYGCLLKDYRICNW